MTLTSYIIAHATDCCELEKKVRSLIKEGWIPQGGLVVQKHDNKTMSFGQAMVK